eukprot:GHUV01050179.1.p1 GENE.GHUV01050179.1~~GHUV01050179.1.p1  ORF type:complete len:229 (+),score=22.99 GHUV01050179.1:82-768(+)
MLTHQRLSTYQVSNILGGVSILFVWCADDAKAAIPYCNRLAQQAHKCGWASQEEQDNTTEHQCPWCGTLWAAEPKHFPKTFEQGNVYYQYLGKIVSLACRPGIIQVRTVFKLLPSNEGCTLLGAKTGTVARNVTVVKRCTLQLPPYSADQEVAAALKARELHCVPCIDCTECPLNAINKWYSDTFTAVYDGCRVFAQGVAEYEPFKACVLFNPGNKFVIAGFEVKEVS